MSRSFCAASCSICCHAPSCVSATSDSSLTGNAPRFCRSASACSRVRQKTYRQPCRLLPIVRTLPYSGTALFAAELCTSSSGSPRLNSCCALHLNPSSVQHESLSTSSASAHPPARTENRCLVEPGVLYYLFFQPMPNASVQRFAASTGAQCGRSYLSQRPT